MSWVDLNESPVCCIICDFGVSPQFDLFPFPLHTSDHTTSSVLLVSCPCLL